MTENNLPSTVSSVSSDDMMALIGQSTMSNSYESIPALVINYADADDQDREVPRGAFKLNNPDGEAVYSKNVTFRPVMQFHQFRVWDNDKSSYSNYSIMIKNWNEEALDISGGVKCGKLTRKQYQFATDYDKERSDKVTTCKILFGLASMKGKDATGEDVELVEVPCMFRVQKSNYMPMEETVESLKQRNILMFNAEVDLGLKREKNGATTYFVVTPKINEDTIPVPFDDLELVKYFQEYVDKTNATIISKYRSAINKRGDDVIDVEADVVDDLTSDFHDDEIPF